MKGLSVNERLRRQLTSVRKKLRLTQRELAIKLGTVQSYVAKIEAGERPLRVAEYLDYCEALGINAARLLDNISKGE